jgi:hypothetical protein
LNLDHVHQTLQNIDPMKQLEKKYEEELQEKEDLLKREKLEKERAEEMMRVLEEQLIKGGGGGETVEGRKYKELRNKVKRQRMEK